MNKKNMVVAWCYSKCDAAGVVVVKNGVDNVKMEPNTTSRIHPGLGKYPGTVITMCFVSIPICRLQFECLSSLARWSCCVDE
jgi:hypothetical protein